MGILASESMTEILAAVRELAGDPAATAVFVRLFQASPFPLQVYDCDGHSLLVNEAFRTLFGSEPPREYTVLADPVAQRAGLEPLIRRAFAGEVTHIPPAWYDVAALPVRGPGHAPRVGVEARLVPVHGEDGALTCVLAFFNDCTAVMAAQERLVHALEDERLARADADAQRERLAALFAQATQQSHSLYRQAPVAIAVWNGPLHTFELANERYLRMVSRDDVVGRTIRDVFGELPEVCALHDHVYATGESFTAPEYEVRFDRRGDGSRERGFFSFTLGPVRDVEGRIGGLIAVAFEVTDQVAARERSTSLAALLGASEARFRAVQQMSPDGFMMFRSVREGQRIVDFEWVYVNPAAERLVGRKDAELVGKRLLQEMPGNREEGLFDAYVSVVESGDAFRRELTYAHEGLARAFRILAVRLEDGFAVTFEDVTDRARAEAERAALLVTLEAARADAELERERAETANRLKDEFLATISHELRTPLQAILGWSELLQADGEPTSERVRKGLAVIERNGRAQSTIIEDILDVSRIITGKLRLDVKKVAVGTVIAAAIDSLRAAAAAKEIRLDVSLPEDLAAIRADAGRLQQIVWNLVGNAIKFTPAHGKVHVSAHRSVSSLTISVSDSGCGIAREFLPFVFERFRQADGTTTRNQGGLGLGLAIVRHLAELHGGRATAESGGEGRGATFEVVLPLASVSTHPPPSENLPAGASVAPVDAPSPSLTGIRVLVVDDEADARELVELIFADAGANVRTADSAESALRFLRSEPTDLVVADIGMPREDGYAFIRRARTLDGATSRVPAVALTAYATAEDRRLALDAGFDDFMTKPVHPRALVEMAARLTK